MKKKSLFLLILLIKVSFVFSQSDSSPTFSGFYINSLDFFPQGILFGTGCGSFAVRDKYISPEKYSGGIQILKLAWSKVHGEKYVYETTFDYVYGAKIKNYGVSAEVQEFTLNHIFLFPTNREHYLFNNKLVA